MKSTYIDRDFIRWESIYILHSTHKNKGIIIETNPETHGYILYHTYLYKGRVRVYSMEQENKTQDELTADETARLDFEYDCWKDSQMIDHYDGSR